MPAQSSPGMDALSNGINMYTKALMTQGMADASEKRKEAKQASNLKKFEAFAKSQGKELKYKMGSDGMSAEYYDDKPNYQLALQGIGDDKTLKTIAEQIGASPEQIVGMQPGDINVDQNFKEIPVTPTPQDYRRYIQGAVPDLKKRNSKVSFEQDVIDVQSGASTWPDLIAKHPSKVNAIQKIKNGLDMAASDSADASASPVSASGDVRSQATAELTKAGYPLTPKNIEAAMKQLSAK